MRSIEKQWKNIKDTGCVGCRRNGADEFPYGHLQEYLNDRGFAPLAKMVDWQGSEFEGNEGTRTEAIRKRSKHFINTRKLEIKSQNSRLYFDILKNEAHIRLTSSVWHAAFALRYVAVFGIILGVVDNAIPACTGIVHHASPACRMSIAHFGAILLPTIALLSAIASKLSIELFFHYQRVREIVYVLQAWQLSAPPIPDMKKNDNEPPPQT